MKHTLATCAMIFALGTASAVHANEKLAQSSGCTSCHSVDKKVLGPAYKEIAGKYRSDKAAAASLFKKVKGGSQGAWGSIPMPPNPHVKDDDIKTLVQWILTQK